jgi:hypothetical protein
MLRAMETVARAQALVARAQAVAAEYRVRQDELRTRSLEYTAARERLRVVVQSHALEFRESGISRDDAWLFIANALREGMVPAGPEWADAGELQHAVTGWCATVYSPA